MRIGLLGDSTTEVNYLDLPDRWPTLLAARMGAVVDNFGDSGKATLDFLAGGSNRSWISAPLADVYVISFGYNDVTFYDSATFKTHTGTLIADVKSVGAIPVLLTQPVVDYPDRYVNNRNPTIADYNDQYEELAAEQGVMLIDLGGHIGTRIGLGDWDWRIRNYTLLSPPDDTFNNPDVWDATLDAAMEPVHGSLWFTNIHGNLRDQVERASIVALHLYNAPARVPSPGTKATASRDYEEIARMVLVQGVANYKMIEIPGPAALQIVWDGAANFDDTHAIYSTPRRDAVVPLQGAAIANYLDYWSLEEKTSAWIGAIGTTKGSKVMHLGNWRATKLLFAVTPTVAGLVNFYLSEVGDNVR